MATTRGIATRYAGVRFRSRLEARWAHFFDGIGWAWDYEPYDLAGWVPDFAICGARPLLIEVKPALTVDELAVHSDRIAAAADRDFLIIGASWAWPGSYGEIVAGLLGQDVEAWIMRQHPSGWDYDVSPAEWHGCTACGSPAVHHSVQMFHGYPCGHYDGNAYCGEPNMAKLWAAWREATNATQWRPPR